MAALNQIIDHIKKETESNVNSIISEAQSFSDNMMSEFKKNADEEISGINKKCEQELKSIADRSISSSELKKKQIELECRQTIILEVIEKAKEKLINAPDEEYVEYVKKVFAKNVPTKDCSIIFNDKDLKRIPKKVIDELGKMAKDNGAKLTLSDKTANIKSGFVLDFGNVEGNCSFESLIDQNLDELIDKVNGILFS